MNVSALAKFDAGDIGYARSEKSVSNAWIEQNEALMGKGMVYLGIQLHDGHLIFRVFVRHDEQLGLQLSI